MGKPLVDLFWIPFSSLPGEEIAFLDFRFPPTPGSTQSPEAEAEVRASVGVRDYTLNRSHGGAGQGRGGQGEGRREFLLFFLP